MKYEISKLHIKMQNVYTEEPNYSTAIPEILFGLFNRVTHRTNTSIYKYCPIPVNVVGRQTE